MPNNRRGFNRELITTALGVALNFCRFTVGASGAVGTLKQASSNSIRSITRTGAGLYTVQFNQPYPAALAFSDVRLHRAAVTDATRVADVDAASYNNTTGQCAIHVSDNDADNNGSVVAADPVQDSEMHLFFVEVRSEFLDK
jgi:hypothetical protein